MWQADGVSRSSPDVRGSANALKEAWHRLQHADAGAGPPDEFRLARTSEIRVSDDDDEGVAQTADADASLRSIPLAGTARASSSSAFHRSRGYRAGSRPQRVPEGFERLVDPLTWLREEHVHESSDLPPFDIVVFLFQSLVHILFPWSLPFYVAVAYYWLPKGSLLQAVRVQGFLPLTWASVPRTVVIEWLMPLCCQVLRLPRP
jgi:hypothetical protein